MSYFPDGLDSRSAENISNSDLSEKTAIAPDSSSKASCQSPESEDDLAREKVLSKIGGEEAAAAENAALEQLPWHIRRIVSTHDDTTLPTITFRYFLMCFIFIPPGAFLNQLNMYRTTSAPYSIFFVQVAASYLGDWLARTLPSWNVRMPFTKWSFNTNPGPFSVKEHVLVVIAAASGATYNLAWTPISLSELYFGRLLTRQWPFFLC
jgi:hypothetical protein